MRIFLISFALLFALAITAMGTTITNTEVLYDQSTGETNCTVNGLTTKCTYYNTWSNGTLTTTTSTYSGEGWFSANNQTVNNYNWGTSQGSYWFTNFGGGGWNEADFSNSYVSQWRGGSLSDNGNGALWEGYGNNSTHTIMNSIFVWACDNAGKCQNDTWWWTTEDRYYDTASSYISFIDGTLTYSPFKDSASFLILDFGHITNTWNQDGSSETPEPETWALLGAGLLLIGMLRRRGRK